MTCIEKALSMIHISTDDGVPEVIKNFLKDEIHTAIKNYIINRTCFGGVWRRSALKKTVFYSPCEGNCKNHTCVKCWQSKYQEGEQQ